MNIDRSHIISDLINFSMAGNGLVTGKPGIGKSYSIAQLSEKLLEQDIPAVIVRVDELFDASDLEIGSAVGLDENWCSSLKGLNTKGETKAIFIFDAFDSARDSNLRNQVLNQIKKAIKQLNGWNILVTARTFDAEKSPDLQKIFGQEGTGGKIKCRSYEIKELNETELESLFKNQPYFRTIYKDGTDSLKDVLRIPFFLKLMNQIFIDQGVKGIEKISGFKSEVELLELYWTEKVSNRENYLELEAFLTKFSKLLVEKISLVCKKELLTDSSQIFKELRSNDLISEVGILEENVAFSHNILFDYIVGRQVIPDDSDRIENFIEGNSLRQFFLRPSFVYKLTLIWHKERDKFWRIYFGLKKSNSEKILLFHKLIPTTIVALQFEDWLDLNPISNKKEEIKYLLQAIRFLENIKYEKREIDLLNQISKNIELEFVWEFSHILDRIFKKLNEYKDSEIKLVGEIGRTFFYFILQKRLEEGISSNTKVSLDRLGSIKGVEYVSKTFFTDTKASRELILKILELLNEPGFEIYYFNNLCDNVKEFFEHDPGLASEVYLKLFGHVESSEEETIMGPQSVVMSLRSTRRQDFEMCHYRLEQNFPAFLEKAPQHAVTTGLKIVNGYSIHRNQSPIEAIKEKNNIQIGRKKYTFYTDLSYMWGDSLSYHKPAQLITHIIDYFNSLKKSKEFNSRDPLIQLYLSESKAGITWSKFIEFANKTPKLFKNLLYQILLNSEILSSTSTTYQIGESISKIYPLLNEKKRNRLVKSILNFKKEDSEPSYLIWIKRKMLSAIPKDLLESQEANLFLKEHGSLPNEPLFNNSSSIRPYRSTDWLRDNGIDTGTEKNKAIIDRIERLEKFNYANHNNTPNRGDFEQLITDASWLFDKVDSIGDLEEDLKFNLLKNLAGFVSIISASSTKFNEIEYGLFVEITKSAISYFSKYDPSTNEADSPISGYSPTPRREAAGALINLILIKKNVEILSLIPTTASDRDAIVRFKVLSNLSLMWEIDKELFWKIVTDRTLNETDYFNLTILIQNIYRNEILKESLPDVERSFNEISDRTNEFKSRESFTEIYSRILLHLFDHYKSEVAKRIIYSNLDDPFFVKGLLFVLFDFIDPKYQENDYSEKVTLKNLLQLLDEVVEKILMEYKEIKITEITEESKEKELIGIIDSIIQRIYFNLAINDRIIKKGDLIPTDANRLNYFITMMPTIESIVSASENLGHLIGHTAHYLMETLNGMVALGLDRQTVGWILNIAARTVQISKESGYGFDYHSIDEVVKLTEAILADHKELLREKEGIEELVKMLKVYVELGWPQASSLLWRLDEAFR